MRTQSVERVQQNLDHLATLVLGAPGAGALGDVQAAWSGLSAALAARAVPQALADIDKRGDELLGIVQKTQSTVVMVTHDVDEAVLLSDRIVMLTNGPAATIGEVLKVDIARPRNRVELAEDPVYVHARKAVIDFLYTRQAHVEKVAA